MVTPPPSPICVPSTDGVTLALHDLGGDGPPLLLCHPTGFLAATWAPLAAELAGVAHCWALDFRGHGDSTAPASGDYAWDGMADDVLAVVDHLGLTGVHGVGHSMGGAALLMAEERRPGTFAGMWLYEPIVTPPSEGGDTGGVRVNPMADAARRRRPWFPDREAAYANFASKPPLSTLAPAALRAYVDHALRDVPGADDDGTIALKCTPEVEARVFEGSLQPTLFARLGEVLCPVTVAVSGDAAGPAFLGPLVADALADGRLERHPTLTHFGPMQDPAGLAAAVRAALELG
jgi:pimeloyl-ACP methyl ester carboxylesterase